MQKWIVNMGDRNGLKDRVLRVVGAITLIVLGVSLSMIIIDFLDVYANGALLNWFTWNYTRQYLDAAGNYVYTIDWQRVRVLMLTVTAFGVALWITALYIVGGIYAKRQVRRSITRISQMICDYMAHDRDAAEVFPREYAEISAQVAQIKSTIQRHEHFMKEETSRKDDLIVYLAHDLKTPLTSIIGYLSLLEEAPDMPAEQKAKYVNITLEKAIRLEQLINEFFEITRYNLQQIILEKENIDLYQMLMQMTDEFYPILQAHGNTAKLCADENLTVYGDPTKLARVFNNILKNAVAYSYPDTVIEIRAQDEGEMVKIEVSNHGKTIPEQRLEAIFEKFFRLDGARATNTGGAGLGLAIAREIVALHGGAITATSAAEVTTFCVELPAKL